MKSERFKGSMVCEQGLNLGICTSGWRKIKRVQVALRTQLPVCLGLEKKAGNVRKFGLCFLAWGLGCFGC